MNYKLVQFRIYGIWFCNLWFGLGLHSSLTLWLASCLYSHCTHCKLFVLHCTATLRQPGTSIGFIDKLKKLAEIRQKTDQHTAVFKELPLLQFILYTYMYTIFNNKEKYFIVFISCFRSCR